jgi:hypothetical protein
VLKFERNSGAKRLKLCRVLSGTKAGHEAKRNGCSNYATVRRPVAEPTFAGKSMFSLLKS